MSKSELFAASITKPERAENKPKNPPSQKQSTTPSSLSLTVAIVAVCIAGLGPLITLDLISFDLSQFCILAPALCESPYLAPQTMDKPLTHYSQAISLEFFNRLSIQVNTYWKDYSGEEQFWFSMEPYSYTGNISSIRGHVWSFRASDTNELLFEEVITQNHCGKIMIAPSEHIEALRQYCSSTGRAVIGHWPRAPLVRHVPQLAPLGSKKVFQSDYTQFESYEGRLQSQVKEITIETISTNPHMLRIDNFLSDEECEHLKEISANRLQLNPDSLEAASTWLEHGESPIVAVITKRIFDLMGFDADVETFYFAEKIQISKYGHHQEYLPHYDAMDFTTAQLSLPHNRYATAMIYLNSLNNKDGGEDVWPRANGADEFARAPCDAEYRILPKKGSLIVMYSMFGDGVVDEASLHGSCPIRTIDTEKWTANMFFWDPFVQWPAFGQTVD